jgi:hypothetical protein
MRSLQTELIDKGLSQALTAEIEQTGIEYG